MAKCGCGDIKCSGHGVMDADHCYVHGYEPLPEAFFDVYLICGECGHFFITEEALETAYTELTDRYLLADDITFCPYCTHSF